MATATAAKIETPARIASLDGWRGIAILLVVVEHAQTTLRGKSVLNTGQHGVTIFFVLSGFLITSKLLKGPINLKRFYTRRFFRLMPVAWTYLAFAVLCDVVFRQHHTSPRALTSCVFFYRNYLPFIPSGAMVHFWSLSMEEQFYLAWPTLLILLGVKRCRWVAIAGIVGCAMWRYTHWAFYNRVGYDYRAEVRADALLVGCLLAILMSTEHGNAVARCWARRCVSPAILGLGYYLVRFTWLPTLGEDVCIAILIVASIDRSGHRWLRWLNAWPLAPLGLVSYSVYVWQAYFFEIRRGPISTPLMMGAMPIFALLSYHYIEQPCRNLGYRITSRSPH